MLRLLLLGMAITIGLWALLWVIGISKLEEDYLEEYEKLKYMVFHSSITTQNYFKIKLKFIQIKKYKCQNKEKISILERNFDGRFIDVKPKKQT